MTNDYESLLYVLLLPRIKILLLPIPVAWFMVAAPRKVQRFTQLLYVCMYRDIQIYLRKPAAENTLLAPGERSALLEDIRKLIKFKALPDKAIKN